MTTETKNPFALGDVVVLKSGSLRMTVVELIGTTKIKTGWSVYGTNTYEEATLPIEAVAVAAHKWSQR